MRLSLFGLLNILSLVYLTGVVALVVGWQESNSEKPSARHILGCWAKLLGGIVALIVIVIVIGLFSG